MRKVLSALALVIAFCLGAVIQTAHNIAPYAFLFGSGATFIALCLTVSLVFATNSALCNECWNCGAEVPRDDAECWNCEVPL